MKLTRARDDKNNKFVFTFEITAAELAAANLLGRMASLWVRKPPSVRPYIELLTNLLDRQREQQDPYANLYDTMRRKFDTRFGFEHNPFDNVYQGGFDPARPGGDRTAYTKPPPPPKPDPEWCRVLELPKTATKAEIKSRYRTLAKTHHPDVGGNAGQFRKITEAYNQAME